MTQHHRFERVATRRGVQARLFTLFLAMLIAGSASAQSDNPPRLSIDDIINMKKVLSVQISPDGQCIAYVTEEPAAQLSRSEQWTTTLAVVSTEGKDTLRLEQKHVSSPQWSPDNSHIAFVESGDGHGPNQLWVAGPRLEAPRQLTHHASSINSFQWSPDSASIAFLAASTDPLPADEAKRIQMGFDAMVLEPYQTTQIRHPTRLSVVTVATGEERDVDAGKLHIMDARWSPDAHSFLLTVADQPYADFEQLRPRLMTLDVRGGTPALFCVTTGKIAGADWSSDGRSAVFLGSVYGDSDFFPGGLFICEGPGSQKRNLTAGAHYTVDEFRLAGNKIVASIVKGNHRFLGVIDPHQNGYQRLTPEDQVFPQRKDYSVDAAGKRIACPLSRWNKPPDVWLVERGSAHQLTHLNPALEHREYGEGREVQWKAKDGLVITGVLSLPAGYQAGHRYPLVTHLHGSTGTEANDFQMQPDHWGQLLAAHGFAVLMVNYRGSATSGAAFVHAFEGDLGGADVDDAMRGADAMVEAGIADPQRLGLSGVSYGGYLTARAITLTTKYRAAVMLSGVPNYWSLHTGFSAAPESAEKLEWLRNPYDIHDFIWDRSPVSHLDRVKTPLLIMWGELDPFIPVMQAMEMFRGLRHFGVESQLVVYPRDGHVPREVNHERDMYQRVVEWFQTHFGTAAN